MKTMTMIAAEAVEEKPIDRQYNAKGEERQTHLEVMGGVFPIRFAPGVLALSSKLRWNNANRKYKKGD